MDELIASMSNNHISQEACDLATLQAQLAQTLGMLNCPTQSQKHYPPPSSPSTLIIMDDSRNNRSRARGRHNVSRERSLSTHRAVQPDEYQEDESMFSSDEGFYDARGVWHPPASSNNASKSYHHSRIQNTPKPTRFMQHYDPRTDSSTAYAALDPFFAAQLNTIQQQQTSMIPAPGHFGQPQTASRFH